MPEQAASYFALPILPAESIYGRADGFYSKPPARVTGWQCCAGSDSLIDAMYCSAATLRKTQCSV
jgi:hypothetical protein